MDEAEIQRLSTLSGLSDFDEFCRQTDGAQSRIEAYLSDNVEEAWARCLPTWQALGRGNDLSRRVRVPKYWPCFAKRLADAFASRFFDDNNVLVRILVESDPNSTNYLIAYDLLESMIAEHRPASEVAHLFALSYPVPPVIRAEIVLLHEYDGVKESTIGQVLERKYDIDWGGDWLDEEDVVDEPS